MHDNGRQRTLRILAPHINSRSFIEKDLDALRERHTVRTADCSSVLRSLRDLGMVFWADCVFCWFGSIRFLPYVLLGRALRKKVVVIAGGYDVARVPEIRYGNMCRFWPRQLGRFLFRCAHLVLPVSRSNLAETQRHARVAADRLCLIYHGFDPAFASDAGLRTPKERLVFTVGTIDKSTVYRKGLITIARLSRRMPDVPFVVAGPYREEALALLKREAGENVQFPGRLSDRQLHDYFARAKVYLQPSLHEAFGCSVAEAMLYDCIPVVSDRYALPEVVGQAGYCVAPTDLDGLADAVRRALAGQTPGDESPRKRVLRAFPWSTRRARLVEAVESQFRTLAGR